LRKTCNKIAKKMQIFIIFNSFSCYTFTQSIKCSWCYLF